MVLDQATMEFDHFWLFFWTRRRAYKRRIGMVGNYPIAVAKDDGQMYVWNMLYPIEDFAEKLRSARWSLPRVE
jgi:hypothetical protein